MATNPALKDEVLKLITQPFVQKINFEINGLRVTGQRYSLLVDYIRKDLIECHVDSNIKPKIDGHYQAGTQVDAMYDIPQHALVFRRQNYGQDQTSVDKSFEERNTFHEATHAIFDIFATSGNDERLGVEDETVAVLAEAYFVKLYPGYSSITFNNLIDGSGQRALELYETLRVKTSDFQDRTVQVLRLDDYRLLKEAVAIEWEYNEHYDKKGHRTDSTNVKHIYKGVPLPGTRAAGNAVPGIVTPDWYRADKK